MAGTARRAWHLTIQWRADRRDPILFVSALPDMTDTNCRWYTCRGKISTPSILPVEHKRLLNDLFWNSTRGTASGDRSESDPCGGIVQMKRRWVKIRTKCVARSSHILRACTAIICAVLLIAASCSAEKGAPSTSSMNAQSSPTPNPSPFPKLKVAPFEPTM